MADVTALADELLRALSPDEFAALRALLEAASASERDGSPTSSSAGLLPERGAGGSSHSPGSASGAASAAEAMPTARPGAGIESEPLGVTRSFMTPLEAELAEREKETP